jgi:hypothetical protein
MIIVSGTPRSGSSLMMQTLKLLDVPIALEDKVDMWGLSYADIDEPDRLMHHNPHGFWQLSEAALGQYLWNAPGHGEAIKVLAPSVGYIPKDKIERVLICERRDKIKQATSLRWLLEDEYPLLDPSPRKLYLQYLLAIDLRKWTVHHQEELEAFLRLLPVPILKIYFEDFLETPDLTVKAIRKFLGSEVDPEKAVNNIITDYY